jgi:hypothetical protein
VEGIFVVERVVESGGLHRGWWKLVPEPTESELSHEYNRFEWIFKYLTKAKQHAMPVAEYVNLGAFKESSL